MTKWYIKMAQWLNVSINGTWYMTKWYIKMVHGT